MSEQPQEGAKSNEARDVLNMVSVREYMDGTRAVLIRMVEERFLAQEKLDIAHNDAFNKRLDYMNVTREQRFSAIEKTMDASSIALNHRLEGMNDVRSQLNSQAALFVNRTEVETEIGSVTRLIDRLEQRTLSLEQAKLNISSHDTLEKRVQALEQLVANFEGRMWSIGAGVGIFSLGVAILLHFLH